MQKYEQIKIIEGTKTSAQKAFNKLLEEHPHWTVISSSTTTYTEPPKKEGDPPKIKTQHSLICGQARA